MVLQNGVAERHNPRRIATEVYSEAVSIKRELQKPVSQAQRQQLDSYYIEFPSLCESYAPPRKDSAEALLGKKQDPVVLLQSPLPQSTSSSTDAVSSPARAALVTEISSKDPEGMPSTRRQQPQSAGRGFAQGRVSSKASQRKPQPSASNRHRPPQGSMAARRGLISAGATPAAPAAQQPMQAAPVPDEPVLPMPGPALPLRLLSKPWKDLEDCGTPRIPRPVAASRESRASRAHHPPDLCASNLQPCCGHDRLMAEAGRQAAAMLPDWEQTRAPSDIAATRVECPAEAGDADCCRDGWQLPVVQASGTCAAPMHRDQVDVGKPSGALSSVSTRCNCHLSCYGLDCCTSLSTNNVGNDEDEDACAVAIEAGCSGHDSEQCCCGRGGLLLGLAGSAAGESAGTASMVCTAGSSLPAAADDVWTAKLCGPPAAADDVWTVTSRLPGYSVHPASSEQLARALLEVCGRGGTAATIVPAGLAGDALGDGHQAHGSSCDHMRYHYELFLESEHCSDGGSNGRTAGGDHCFDWNCYEDQPVGGRGGSDCRENPGSSGSTQKPDGHRPCDSVDSVCRLLVPTGHCHLCGCNLDAGPLRLASGIDAFAGLAQLLPAHVAQLGIRQTGGSGNCRAGDASDRFAIAGGLAAAAGNAGRASGAA